MKCKLFPQILLSAAFFLAGSCSLKAQKYDYYDTFPAFSLSKIISLPNNAVLLTGLQYDTLTFNNAVAWIKLDSNGKVVFRNVHHSYIHPFQFIDAKAINNYYHFLFAGSDSNGSNFTADYVIDTAGNLKSARKLKLNSYYSYYSNIYVAADNINYGYLVIDTNNNVYLTDSNFRKIWEKHFQSVTNIESFHQRIYTYNSVLVDSENSMTILDSNGNLLDSIYLPVKNFYPYNSPYPIFPFYIPCRGPIIAAGTDFYDGDMEFLKVNPSSSTFEQYIDTPFIPSPGYDLDAMDTMSENGFVIHTAIGRVNTFYVHGNDPVTSILYTQDYLISFDKNNRPTGMFTGDLNLGYYSWSLPYSNETVCTLNDNAFVFGYNVYQNGIYWFNNTHIYKFRMGAYSGIEVAPKPLEINFFPNPADNTIHINGNIMPHSQVCIYDMQGKKFTSGYTISDSNVYFDKAKFSTGIYMLEVTTPAGQFYTGKFMLE